MQKIISILLAILLLSISACATASKPPAEPDSAPAATQIAGLVNQELTAAAPPTIVATSTSSTSTRPELNTTYENAVSAEMQLLLGIFKLEGTENAVTKKQAKLLLPLWTNLKNLSQSLMPARGEPGQGQGQPDSTPQVPTVDPEIQTKIEALDKQILAALTPEQIQAISEMKITQETAQTILQEQGITLGGPQANGSGSGSQPPQGTPPAGDPTGDQAGGPGQPPSNGQMSNPKTGEGSANAFIPTELFDALIKLLGEKSTN
jgi:hypothetical protein